MLSAYKILEFQWQHFQIWGWIDRSRKMCVFSTEKSHPFTWDKNHRTWMTLKVSTATGTASSLATAGLPSYYYILLKLELYTSSAWYKIWSFFSLNYKHYVRISGSVIISVREQKSRQFYFWERKFQGTKVLEDQPCITRSAVLDHWQR